MTIFILFLALSSITFFYKRTHDLLCPNGIFLFIWFITAGISSIDYNDFMKPWCPEMYFVVILSGLSYFLGSLFVPQKTEKFKLRHRKELNPSYYKTFYCVYFICFCCFLLEWYKSGFPTILTADTSVGADLKTNLGMKAISGVHYGVLMLPFLSLYAFYALINTYSKRRKIIMLMLFSLVFLCSIFTKMSRGDLVIILLGSIFIYTRYYKFKIRTILVFSILGFGVFVGLALIRISGGIMMSMSNNVYWSIIYSYTATCYANLNELILNNYPIHLEGNATFSFIWTLMGIRDSIDVIAIEQMDVFNARTYLYPFYHDYQYFGVIFFPFLIGIIVSNIYFLTIKSSSLWILLLATLQKAIWMTFFGNYFFGEFVILFPYLFTYLFIVFVYKYRDFKLERTNRIVKYHY